MAHFYSIVATKAAKSSLPGLPRRYSIRQLTTPLVGHIVEEGKTNIANCFPSSYAKTFETAFSDYSTENARPVLLAPRFRLPKPYDMLTEEEVAALDSTKGQFWLEFFKRYPQSSGLLAFSAVGFNSDRTRAVVSVGFGCG
jgi:hypothetical protein